MQLKRSAFPALRGLLAGSLLAAGFVFAASCGEESALSLLGGGCLLNSDCNEGLACVFQRCHIACATTEDCPVTDDGQLRCVVGERPDHVCQLQDELRCAYHSECPGEQLCGPDGECRDQCQDDRDCVGEQTCLPAGVCADPAELNGDGELDDVPPPDGQETGFPCNYDSECIGLAPAGGPEFVCRDGGCNYGCYDDIDCGPNFFCEPRDMDATTPGICATDGTGAQAFCVPNAQVSCECYPPGSGPGIQKCAADGLGYGPCTNGQAEDCSAP